MGNLLVLKCDYSPYVGKLRMYAEWLGSSYKVFEQKLEKDFSEPG